MTDDQITRTARDLSALIDLSAALEAQAIAKANSPDHLPGGAAMVALGPVADPEAWGNLIDGAERWNAEHAFDEDFVPRNVAHAADDDEDWYPPLQLLLFWSSELRREQGQDYGQRPTIQSEASYLKFALEHLWANEPRFDEFVKDVNRARRRLEDVLYAGRRAERVMVACDAEDCERHPRLIKVYSDDPTRDHYKCPSCHRRYDDDAFSRTYARQLRSEGAQKFVRAVDAVGTLRAQGRSERTIRKWFLDCLVEGYCDPVTHEVFAWWPDLWHLHLTTPTRKRKSQAA